MSLTPEGFTEVKASINEINVDSLKDSFERYKNERRSTLESVMDDFLGSEKEIYKNLKKVHKLTNKMTFILKQLQIVNNSVYYELVWEELTNLHNIKEILVKKTTQKKALKIEKTMSLFTTVSREIHRCESQLDVYEQVNERLSKTKELFKNGSYFGSLKKNRSESTDDTVQQFDKTANSYFQNLNSTLQKFKERYNKLCPNEKILNSEKNKNKNNNKNVICYDDVYCESTSNSDSKMGSLGDSSDEGDHADSSYIEPPDNVGRFLTKVKKLKEQKIIFKVVDYRYVCNETKEIIYQDPLNKYITSDSRPNSAESSPTKTLPNGFYQYCVKIHGRNIQPFNIWRRYNSFLKLHSDLSTRHKHVFQLNFPEKKMFGNKSESFVKFRLVLLNDYMCSVAKIISKHKVLLLEFLNGLTDDSDIIAFLKKLHPFFTRDS